MYDLGRINLIIEDIEKYIKKLNNLKLKNEADIDDLKFYASSMMIFDLLNRTIDLAEEVTRSKGLGTPIEYKDFFEMLGNVNIISKKSSKIMADMTRLRNKFAHRYGEIKKLDILNFLRNIPEIKSFVKEIEKEVKK
jgi:uncharacterized protein YutE (UPF0331/DUF86 family)